MRLAIALLALGTLAGCSAKYDLSGAEWTKPGTTVQEVTYDEMECVRGTREVERTADLVVGGLADVGRYLVEERQRKSAYQGCMQARGYQPSAGPGD
jgi:outer membrane lipoprotein SlyB